MRAIQETTPAGSELQQSLLQTIDRIVEFWQQLPGPAEAGLIIVGSILAAKLIDWILVSMIGRWVQKTATTIDDKLVEQLHKPVFLLVLLLGIGLAARSLEFGPSTIFTMEAILQTIGIFVLTVFSIRASRLIITSVSHVRDQYQMIQPRTVPLYYNASLLLIIAAAVYFLFLAWEIELTAWLASAGIIGVALSFAAKDSLANLFAGAFILADAPYKLGDFIILDSGERGKVTQIGLRSTRLLTRDDIEITIPNSVMGNSKITNESGGPHENERVRVPVAVAYGSDLDQVESLLLEIANSHEEILDIPEPRVRFRSFGDSGLNLELLMWIHEPVQRGLMKHLVGKEIYKCLQREGIEIPYPKRDVYLKNKEDQK